jgi:hypothetical protein
MGLSRALSPPLAPISTNSLSMRTISAGLGTYLLQAALRPIPPVVTLNVFAANEPARRLYERHSFREVDRFFNRQDPTVELLLIRNQPVERGISKAK